MNNARLFLLSYILISLIFCPLRVYAEPPQEIPEDLVSEFTLDGKIPILSWYFDDSGEQSLFYSRNLITHYMKKVGSKKSGYYGETDQWLYQVLEKYPIKNKEVAIIGSRTPWYESIVLAYGGRPTTIEYSKIQTDDNRLSIMTVEEFKKKPKKFDLILSISSIEHDGLGRYGDPVNPTADLTFMSFSSQNLLKRGGRMILAVPIGKDCLFWNAHRIYGSLRFPLLVKEWDIIESFGFDDEDFCGELGSYFQPIFYLSPKKINK